MTNLSKAFGIAVRRRREALHVSQEELADQTGLHRTYISLIERGLRNASVETTIKLAKALNTTGSQLLEEVERGINDGPE